MNEPIFSVLTGKPQAQSCDPTTGGCYWCQHLFIANQEYDGGYGTATVTGAGSYTYNDPDDPTNPYNGTYSLNGTYVYFYDMWWIKDGKRMY
jgi:hypothetical protein